MSDVRPIGIFDSGVGGLTVLKAMADILPCENMIYLGDTARVPYGTRSSGTIEKYTLMAAAKLVGMGIKALVIACNTATSASLPAVCAHFPDIPVIGVIEPGAQAAVAATRNSHIAVLATEATINGNAYQRAIAAIAPTATVSARACTLLVPLAEEGWLDGEIAEGVVARYLHGLLNASGSAAPDTLLLGCTHFPLFRAVLQKLAGNGVVIVDSAAATAQAAYRRLAQGSMLNQAHAPGSLRFCTTDHRERFARTGSLFLERSLLPEEIELLDL